MVNISDIAAMGGRPIAVVNAVSGQRTHGSRSNPTGLRAASETFSVPLVGGHTNVRSDRSQLSVAILGKAKRLLTSFDARPGDHLIAAIDLRGRYRDPFPNWEAATDAPSGRLRSDLAILPDIAEARLCVAAKDISQGGIIGTALMLAECSDVGLTVDLTAIPRRRNQHRSTAGYRPSPASDTSSRSRRPTFPRSFPDFTERGIHAGDVGIVSPDHAVRVTLGAETEIIWDFTHQPLLGCTHA